MNKVQEIIDILKDMYNPEDEILFLWWDKDLSYIDNNPVSKGEWSEVLRLLGEDDFQIPSGMIWDTIAETLIKVKERK